MRLSSVLSPLLRRGERKKKRFPNGHEFTQIHRSSGRAIPIRHDSLG